MPSHLPAETQAASVLAVPLPMLRLQHDGVVLASNEAAQSLLMPFGSVMGLNLFRLFPECAAMADKLAQERTSHLQQLLTWTLPGTLDAPSAHEILAFLSPYPANVPTKPHDWQLILVDLSHWLAYWRHDLQQQARQAQQLHLREWAHEINNPLGGLLAATQWWQKSTLPKLPPPLQEDTAPIIDMLLQEINRLRARMKATLSADTAQSKVAINMHQPLEQALQLFIHEFPEVHIVKDYDVSAPDVWVHEESLQPIFDNLLRNAGQAMRRAHTRQPTLRLRSHVLFSVLLQGKNHRLALSLDIEDNGPGMPALNQDAAPLLTVPAHGHGLGLGIVRHLVEEQAAAISLISAAGKTKWTLILPCAA